MKSTSGLFALLLIAAFAVFPVVIQTAQAQTARATTRHALLQKMARIDGLPADLRDEPVRRRLRAVLDRAVHQASAAGAPASRRLHDAVNRALAASQAEEAKLTASDGADDDQFGWSVSIDGDRVLVGALGDEIFQGAAYVFAFDGTDWVEEGRLTAADGEFVDVFGWSVSISGDRALVGAPWDDSFQGSAYIFEFANGAWTQQVKLTASDGAIDDQFGISVSLDGDRALVGAFGDEDFAGAAYVFEFSNGSWTEQARLVPGDIETGDDVGVSVSLDGDRALIGADGEDDNGSAAGAAYIFEFAGGSWTEQAKLLAGDGASMDFFGQAVSLSGDRALIGATLDDDNGTGSGSAYIFALNGGSWTEQAKLLADDGADFGDFGTAVSLSGDRALVGAVGDQNATGAAYEFAFDSGSWTGQAKLTASDGAVGDFYGNGVAIDGDRTVVGAPGHNNATGAAYAFASDGPPPPPPPPHPFLFLADEKIVMEGQVVSVGDLYSNGEIEIKKGNPSTHYGNLTAVDDIKIDKKNTIDGDATAGGSIELKGNATVTGTITENADVDPMPLPSFSFSAGGQEIFVDKNRTRVLAPGTYGDLKVEINATLILSTGEYFFEQAEFKKEAVLRADVSGGPVTLNVVSDVKFEKETEVDIVPLGDAGSPFFRINTYDDLTIKKDARVFGTFVSSEGNLQIEKDGFFQGLACARQIEVKKRGTLLIHGASIPSMQASAQEAPAPVAAVAATTDEAPDAFRLASNYPNPFNPVTTIAFALPQAEAVQLVVYDVTGREVARLVEGPMAAGRHQIQFDASGLPSGVYLYRLTAGPFTETRRMVLVK